MDKSYTAKAAWPRATMADKEKPRRLAPPGFYQGYRNLLFRKIEADRDPDSTAIDRLTVL